MTASAIFRFWGNLNDFLSPEKRHRELIYHFHGTPALKDAIEAIGIPHPEVDVILLNGAPAAFSSHLHAQDQVEIYPASSQNLLLAVHSLQAKLPPSDKFILDVQLGKLAKSLRLLGFDTTYQTDYHNAAIAKLAAHENRIVLTRDVGLLKHKLINRGYWLRSQHPEEQLKEVIEYFKLQSLYKPFSRCLACNGQLQAVPKELVLEKLPPKTRLYFNEFYHCSACERVYWKGSHYERMQEFIQRLQSLPRPDSDK